MHDKISPLDTVDTYVAQSKVSLWSTTNRTHRCLLFYLDVPLHILLKFSYSVEKLFGYSHFQHIFSLKISLVKVRVSKCPNGLIINKTIKLECA